MCVARRGCSCRGGGDATLLPDAGAASRACGCAALQAAGRLPDAIVAFERAAWLARAYDGDAAAEQARLRVHCFALLCVGTLRGVSLGAGRCVCAQEYEAAVTAVKTAQMARGGRQRAASVSRDGF
jgi:hypothetical protein